MIKQPNTRLTNPPREDPTNSIEYKAMEELKKIRQDNPDLFNKK